MLTAAQQYAIDQFSKGLLALSDDALIDTYHQAADDLRAARAEGSDNLSKAYEQTLATEKAMRDRFSDYRARYKSLTQNELSDFSNLCIRLVGKRDGSARCGLKPLNSNIAAMVFAMQAT